MHRPRVALRRSLVVLLALAAWAHARTAAPQPGASVAPFTATDELSVVRALVGPVERGERQRPRARSVEAPMPGFLDVPKTTLHQVLLSESYVEAGVARHAIVLGGHFIGDDGTIDDAHGQATAIAAAVLEFRDGRWEVVLQAPSLMRAGQYGQPPQVSLRRIGEARHAIEITAHYMGQGYTSTSVTLYEAGGASFIEILNLDITGGYDAVDAQASYSYTGSLVTDQKTGPKSFDLLLALKGTYRDARQRIVRVRAAPLRLRSSGGAYELVDRSEAARAVWTIVTGPR